MNIYQKYHQKVLKDIENGKRVSPLKAIRAFYLECVGFSAQEVDKCSAHEEYTCPLFKYRFGRNQSAPRLSPVAHTKTSWTSRLKVKSKKV